MTALNPNLERRSAFGDKAAWVPVTVPEMSEYLSSDVLKEVSKSCRDDASASNFADSQYYVTKKVIDSGKENINTNENGQEGVCEATLPPWVAHQRMYGGGILTEGDEDAQSVAFSQYSAASWMTSVTQTGKYKKTQDEEIADLFSSQDESISRGVFMSGMDVSLLLAHLHRNTVRHLIIEDPLKNRIFTDQELQFVAAALKNGNSSVVSLQIVGCEGICGDESLIQLFGALERHPAIRSVGIRGIPRCRRMADKLTPNVISAIKKKRQEARKSKSDDLMTMKGVAVFGSHEINRVVVTSSKVDPPPCISEVGAGAALCKLVCSNPSIIHVELGRPLAEGVSMMKNKAAAPKDTMSGLTSGAYVPPTNEEQANDDGEPVEPVAECEGAVSETTTTPSSGNAPPRREEATKEPSAVPRLIEPAFGTLILTEEHEELLYQAIEYNRLFSPHRSAKDNAHDASLLRLLLSAEDRAALLEQQVEAVNPYMFDASSGQLAPHVLENLRRQFEKGDTEGTSEVVVKKNKPKKKKAVRFGLDEGDVVRPVCSDFMNGACRFGSRCKFVHPEVVVPSHMLNITRSTDLPDGDAPDTSQLNETPNCEDTSVSQTRQSSSMLSARSQLRGRTGASFTFKAKPQPPQAELATQHVGGNEIVSSPREEPPTSTPHHVRGMLGSLVARFIPFLVHSREAQDGGGGASYPEETESSRATEPPEPTGPSRRRVVIDGTALRARLSQGADL